MSSWDTITLEAWQAVVPHESYSLAKHRYETPEDWWKGRKEADDMLFFVGKLLGSGALIQLIHEDDISMFPAAVYATVETLRLLREEDERVDDAEYAVFKLTEVQRDMVYTIRDRVSWSLLELAWSQTMSDASDAERIADYRTEKGLVG